jgi:hypothetical protein
MSLCECNASGLEAKFATETPMIPPSPPKRFHRLRELLVPVIMLVIVGFYAYSSAQLSSTALIFPGVLILVIVATLLWPIAATFGRPAPTAASTDEESGAILDLRPWVLFGLPVLLFTVFEYLGALISMIILVYGSQLVLSTKSPIAGFFLAVCVTVPVYALFKYFLYVRFPIGVLGIG